MDEYNMICCLQDERKVSAADRDNCVMTLRCLHLFYGYSPETFALAVNLLDRFLTKVKVQPKYLACISTTCYFIASKTIEENAVSGKNLGQSQMDKTR